MKKCNDELQLFWQLRDGTGLLRELRSLRIGSLAYRDGEMKGYAPGDIRALKSSQKDMDHAMRGRVRMDRFCKLPESGVPGVSVLQFLS